MEFCRVQGRRPVGLGGPRPGHPAGPRDGRRGPVRGHRRRLWDALPAGARDDGLVFTDVRASYGAVVPKDQHPAVGKETGETAHIERFRLTLRQRCARFVRKTLSFSKCERNHVGALWYFIRLYNLCHQ